MKKKATTRTATPTTRQPSFRYTSSPDAVVNPSANTIPAEVIAPNKLKRGKRTTDFADDTDRAQKSATSALSGVKTDARNLPTGWQLTALGAICERITNGSSPNWQGFNYCDEGIIFVRSQNVGWGALKLDQVAHLPPAFNEKGKKSVLKSDDVLLNLVGASIERACVATAEVDGGNVNQAVAVIRVHQDVILPKFLALYLISPSAQSNIHSEKVDVARANFSLEDVRILRIPLPALAEQQRIVAEIEKQFTRLDAGVAALRRVQANLKRYRAAVLKAACEGKLVSTEADWNQIPLKELIGKISQGWSPKCDLTRDALPDEWAIMTTTAVQSMRYIDNQGKPLPSTFTPRPNIEIKVGDFLMTRKGPRKRAGVACLVRTTRSRLLFCDTVYRFRCHASRVVPGYLELALNSPSVVEAIDRQKAGINESGVSLTHDKLGGVLITFPPLAEQTGIVAEVERRFSVVEKLETVVAANLQRAASLRQSLLQKAFTGNLSPLSGSALRDYHDSINNKGNQ